MSCSYALRCAAISEIYTLSLHDALPISDKAEQIGLVNRVVAAETLEQETLDLAKLIASKSPKTLAIGKKAFYTQNTMTLANAYDYTAQVMADNLDAVDAKEGICAFVEKREPKWRGE